MSADIEYPEAYERWTLKNQVLDDNVTKILSPLKIQTPDACAYFALVVTMEANLRLQCNRNVNLSTEHLEQLGKDSKKKMPNERGKIKRLLLMIRDEGVYEERHYRKLMKSEIGPRKCKITSFQAYHVGIPDDIKRALRQLRRGGPLLAVIRISHNYNDCFSGMMYRFDPKQVVELDGQPVTHAVSVVSFGIEADVPFLECQDSRGEDFGRRGYYFNQGVV